MPGPVNKIRLGIDAKWFFSGPPSGHMVVKNLVEQIVKNNNGQFEIYLFFCSKNKADAANYFIDDAKIIFVPNLPNLLSNSYLLPLFALWYKIDIILFQNFGSLWPQKLFKIAYIHDVLFLDYPQYYSKQERFYFGNMIRLASKANFIITISKSEKMRLINNHVAEDKNIGVVYHGVNDKFKPVQAFSNEINSYVTKKYQLPDRYLLYVGRVNIRKNLVNLVKSFRTIADQDIKLLIVGDQGAEHGELFNYINEKKLGDRIIFTGHVAEDDLYLIYAKALIFCFPSYAEGFGLPPLEAMRCGVPVIVSNRTAMPEICGNAAVYIDPDDTRDIAIKITTLLSDQDFYSKMVNAGIACAKEFDWKKSATEILTLIQNAYVSRKNYSQA